MNCDHCGKPVNLNAKFCGKCGAFLNFSKKIQAEASAAAALAFLATEQSAAVVSAQLESVSVQAESIEANPAVEHSHSQPDHLSNLNVNHQDNLDSLIDAAVQSHEHHDIQHDNPSEIHHSAEHLSEHAPEVEPLSTLTQASALEASDVSTPQAHVIETVAHEAHTVSAQEPVHASTELHPDAPVGATVQLPQTNHPVSEAPVNIEQLAPILNNPIPVLTAEFGASLDELRTAIDGMRQEMGAKVADIKGDVHATAQALAQRIHTAQAAQAAQVAPAVDMQGVNSKMDQLRTDIAAQLEELKAFWTNSAQSLVGKNSDDMQAILSAEFKKIQTGIVNLYNTQQNNIVKSTAAFDEVVAALTFKIQNIENFVNGQLASQAQAQSAAQTANRAMATAVNEIRAQLQQQQELLSGLTIDPALIKTMNSFNINFRKQQEQLAASQAQAQAQAQAQVKNVVKTKSTESSSISDTVVMWFVGFLCGLTLLLGGFSVYNYYAAQDVKAELHKKKVEESLKLKDKSEDEHSEKESSKSEVEEPAKGIAKDEPKSAQDKEPSDKSKENKENEKERLEKSEKSDKSEKGGEHGKEKANSKSSEREKGEEKSAEKTTSKKRTSNEKE